MEKWTELVGEFCSLVGDYRREDDITVITPGRVSRWVRQFERYGFSQDGMKRILKSLSSVLKRTYISRERTIDFLIRLVKRVEKRSGVGKHHINFLSLQKQGKSQSDMLALTEEYVLGRSIGDCGGSDVYLYMDDVVYSGNRFRYELSGWINDQAPKGARIYSGHMVMHTQGAQYAIGQIRKVAESKEVAFFSAKQTSFSNNKKFRTYEALWPRAINDPKVQEYIRRSQARALSKFGFAPIIARDHAVECDLLSSEERVFLENAFLACGIELVNAAASPSQNMRPMGFEVLEGFGFGALTVTWRNIANNCPLALWYGDPDNYPQDHPFGQWFPLFPRKGGY